MSLEPVILNKLTNLSNTTVDINDSTSFTGRIIGDTMPYWSAEGKVTIGNETWLNGGYIETDLAAYPLAPVLELLDSNDHIYPEAATNKQTDAIAIGAGKIWTWTNDVKAWSEHDMNGTATGRTETLGFGTSSSKIYRLNGFMYVIYDGTVHKYDLTLTNLLATYTTYDDISRLTYINGFIWAHRPGVGNDYDLSKLTTAFVDTGIVKSVKVVSPPQSPIPYDFYFDSFLWDGFVWFTVSEWAYKYTLDLEYTGTRIAVAGEDGSGVYRHSYFMGDDGDVFILHYGSYGLARLITGIGFSGPEKVFGAPLFMRIA